MAGPLALHVPWGLLLRTGSLQLYPHCSHNNCSELLGRGSLQVFLRLRPRFCCVLLAKSQGKTSKRQNLQSP